MLFDYRKQTKLVSLEGVIAWLETKDPEEKYNFGDCKGYCLFSQYMNDRLHLVPDYPSRGGIEYLTDWSELHNLYREVAIPKGSADGVWTFSDALKRARKLQADGVV